MAAKKGAKKPKKAAKRPAPKATAKKPAKAPGRSAGKRPSGGGGLAVKAVAPKAAPPAGVPSMLGGAPTSSRGLDDGEE
jgi:hypothetical protein